MTASSTQYLESVPKFELLVAASSNAWRQLGITPVEEFIEQLQKEDVAKH